MATPQEPTEGALEGAAYVRDAIAQRFTDADVAHQVLSTISTVFNSTIYLTITAGILVFFFYLLRWTVTQSGSDANVKACKGAFKAFVTIFLMVSIWGIIRAIDRIVFFSPVAEYLAFVVFVAACVAWTSLNLGKSASGLVLHGLLAADRGIRYVRPFFNRITRIAAMDDRTFRVFLIAALCLIATPFSLYWMMGLDADEAPAMPDLEAPTGFSEPIIREEGDAVVHGSTYTNVRYGISITYPPGWEIKEIESPDHDGLVEAYNAKLNAHSRLNGGIFPDIQGRSNTSYLTAWWRVSKTIQSAFAAESDGIMWSEVTPVDGSTSASTTRLALVAFWPMPDGTSGLFQDYYYMFGTGPVYFTLQFGSHFENSSEALLADAEAVMRSVEVSESQLSR